eukprot:CAMPEP_0117442714 /NCGR_PEP_ID=MMETSP0759-20121206/4301_1 /TAXON_ID=63605 /ORGANISM="Percolomonas cosmopolitus, Strain WS" /LENGTH=91 /DNA_ID=CAMNT_0005234625 /DNA_START=119 /DNA_END=394 /DNA_ORIENTATION=-
MSNVTDEDEKKLQAGALELRSKIPGILDLQFGRGIILAENRQNGYTHCLRVLFKDAEALKEYLPHEVHLKFKEMLLKNLTGELTVMDWERD